MFKFGKRALSVACCAAIVASMTACSSPSSRLDDDIEVNVEESVDEAVSEASKEVKEEVSDESANETSNDESEDAGETHEVVSAEDFESDADPYSMYSFTVDGKTYCVPMELSVFLDSGWFFSTNYGVTNPDVLASGEDARIYLHYGKEAKMDMSFFVKNYGDTATVIEKCTVIGVDINDDTFDETGYSFSLHGGDITFGATPDEVEAVFGEFDNDIGEGNVHFAMYFQDHNNRDRDHMITFNFTGGNDTLGSVEIEYED